MKKAAAFSLVVLFFFSLGTILSLADDVSFHQVKVPDLKGKQTPAVLTFSDGDKAIEVRPVKGDIVKIPYGVIDNCSYEYTKKHRIVQGVMIGAVSPAAGVIVGFTKSRSHWLEIDYREQDIAKAFVLRMDKNEYLRILDALKAHTGIDAEILGNADKR